MKLAITNEAEIKDLMNICVELEEFSKELNHYNYEDIDLETEENKEHYKILYPIWKRADNMEEFMTECFKQFDIIHFRRILWNLSTMLVNCADLSKDDLDFNTEIKAGQEAIEVLKEIDNYISPNPDTYIGFDSVLHNKIKAILSNVPVDNEVSQNEA